MKIIISFANQKSFNRKLITFVGLNIILGNLKLTIGREETYTHLLELFRRADEKYNSGLFGIIVTNKWMRANYGEPLRKWIKIRNIREIIDFGDLQVFKGATTYPCILICDSEVEKQISVTSMKTLLFDSLEQYVKENRVSIDQSLLDDSGWNLGSEEEQQLLEKIRTAGIPLGEYVKGKIYYGIKTGLNEALVIDKATRERLILEDPRSAEVIKPFLAGRDIKRYQPPESDKYLIFTKRGIDINSYPSIKNHLLQFKKQLMPKPKDFYGDQWPGRKPGSYKWYEIQDAVDYYAEFEKPKLIYPNILSKPEFTYDSEKSLHDSIISNVELILQLNKDLRAATLPDQKDQIKARIEYCDDKINKMVYQLYGLTQEEIMIVEKFR